MDRCTHRQHVILNELACTTQDSLSLSKLTSAVQEIAKRDAKIKGKSKSTVFRDLEILCDYGLVLRCNPSGYSIKTRPLTKRVAKRFITWIDTNEDGQSEIIALVNQASANRLVRHGVPWLVIRTARQAWQPSIGSNPIGAGL